MNDEIEKLFEGIEIEKRKQINALMSDWRSEIASKDRSEYFEKEDPLSYFVSDGFFPGYYNQKIKVLFINRETRYMTDEGDYIECLIKYFKTNFLQRIHRRLLYIIQGIKNNGKLKFEEVKMKKYIDIAKEMVHTNDYGFAYMNISKYSNCLDDPKADYVLINKFLEHSNLGNRNYFREELEILNPDIIITGNLWVREINAEYLDLCFGKLAWQDIDGKINVSNIILNRKNIKLINTYAFADRHSDKEFFYDPIMETIFGKN